MSVINNLKIRTRLLGAFALVLALLAVTAITGYWGISSVSNYTERMLSTDAKMAEYSARLRANVHAMRQYEKDMIINLKTREKVKEYQKQWLEEYKGGQEKIDLMEKVMVLMSGSEAEKEKQDLKKIKEHLAEYNAGIEKLYDQLMTGKIVTAEAGNASIGEHKAAIRDLADIAKAEAAQYVKRMEKVEGEVNGIKTRAIIIMLIFSLSAVLAGIFISLFISGNIINPVKKALEFSRKLAEGDFTMRIGLDQKDEMGVLGGALDRATESLEDLISSVRVAAQNLAEAVEQISSGNQNLSQRTSEQASSLEEVASTIEETTATINQNADNADKAKELTEGGAQKSREGNNVALVAVDSINEINTSSKRIGEIISVINDIAFQTNLLALNAAVEAARAGEQGRGFAVVAGEVRNLAQRSANAAKEIESLISTAIDKIEKGTGMVHKTGESLNEISKAAELSARIIADIALASQEQKQGIGQINNAIAELDSMTQQNASLVEETASASEEMANQARELFEMMDKFKLTKTDTREGEHTARIHLRAAELYKKKDDSGNGRKKIAAKPAAETHDAKTGGLKELFKKEGFEEF